MSYADGLKIIITIKYNSLELDITGGDDDTKPFGKGDNYGLRQSSYASTTLAYLDYPSVLNGTANTQVASHWDFYGWIGNFIRHP